MKQLQKISGKKSGYSVVSLILISALVLLAAMTSGCLNEDADPADGSVPEVSSPSDDGNIGNDDNRDDRTDRDNEINDDSGTENNAGKSSGAGTDSFERPSPSDVITAKSSGRGSGGSNGSSIWLKSVSNPFIGTWVSDPDENGVILVFKGYSDGTFGYEWKGKRTNTGLPDPAEGSGAYLVRKDADGSNIMIAYFDSGDVKSISFDVRSDSVIDAAEFVLVTDDVNEKSVKKYGKTVHFTREGKLVRSDYIDTCFPENILTDGAEFGWGADFPEPDEETAAFVKSILGRDYYSSLWEFDNAGNAVCTFTDLGMLMNAFGEETDSKDIPYLFSYVIYENDDNPYDGVIVLYTEDESGNQLFV